MQKGVGSAISTYEDRQRAEARSKAEAFARELDYSLADLFSAEVKATRARPCETPPPEEHYGRLVQPRAKAAMVRRRAAIGKNGREPGQRLRKDWRCGRPEADTSGLVFRRGAASSKQT